MKRPIFVTIIILSLLGLASSFIATQEYFEVQKIGFEAKSFCSLSETINCDAAHASRFAHVGPLPIAWLGFLFFLNHLILAFIAKRRSAETFKPVATLAWILGLCGVAATFAMIYISVFILKVLCLICLAMMLATFGLFLCWQIILKRPLFKPFEWGMTFFLLLLFGVGSFGMTNYHNKILQRPKIDIPISDIVRFHMRQSQYDFAVDPKAPVWGNPEAKVTLVEFSDFQCSHCRAAAFSLKPILYEFRDQIRFVYYHYPIDSNCNEAIVGRFHEQSCLASYASSCAARFGDFWSYHDDLFRNQKKLGIDLFLKLAKNRGWDEKEFEACLKDPTIVDSVKANVAQGNKIYIQGTPTILINNRRLKYWNLPEILRAVLNEEIKQAGAH